MAKKFEFVNMIGVLESLFQELGMGENLTFIVLASGFDSGKAQWSLSPFYPGFRILLRNL